MKDNIRAFMKEYIKYDARFRMYNQITKYPEAMATIINIDKVKDKELIEKFKELINGLTYVLEEAAKK